MYISTTMHAIVSAPGYQQVITHVFVDGDPHLESDAVYAVKNSLVSKYKKMSDAEARKVGLPSGSFKVEFDFKLSPQSGVKARKKIAASDTVGA